MEEKNEAYQYQWIINEGLLRDEGTLFGIAGAATQDKIAAIKDYYRIKKASARTKREQLEKEIEELRGDLLMLLAENGQPGNRAIVLNLFPIIFQMVLYVGICFFNFYLEAYWLSPVLHSTLICVGLYLFGLFPVFAGRSIMYNTSMMLNDEKASDERRENWKIYLEEFGVPLIVSLFISILPERAYPVLFTILAALVFFSLFLLSGKALVNTIFRIRTESGRWIHEIRKKREHKMKSEKLHALQAELILSLAALEELDGEEDYRINIFTSEYNLASENRQLAAKVSVKKLA